MAENVPIYIQLETGEAERNIGNIKRAVKELTDAALASGDAQSEAYQKAIQKAGALKDEIGDIKDGIGTFSGDPIESLSKGFGTLKGKLMDLDFKGFSEEVGRLKTVSKQVTFKELSSSVGDTASSFANLGKILLTNPIFLIATIVAAIIANFDKLTQAGGILGTVFSAIGDTINFVIDKLKMLSDWLGLTDFKGQEKANNTLKNAEKEQAAIEQRYDAEIAIAEAAGKDTEQIELDKQLAIRQSIQLQIDQLNYLAKSQGKLTEDQQKQLDDLNSQYKASLTETAVITANAQREAQEEEDKAEEQRREKAQQRAQQRAQQIKKEREEVNNFLASEDERRLQDGLSAENKELRQAELKYLELQKLANGNATLLTEIEQDYRLKKEEITKKFDDIEKAKAVENNQKRLDAQEQEFNARLEAFGTNEDIEIQAVNAKYDKLFETLTLNAEEEKLLVEKQQAEVSAINTKYRDEELAKEKEKVEAQIALDQQVVDAQNQLNQARVGAVTAGFELLNTVFGKNKKAQNVLFLAQRAFEASQVVINGLKNAAILKGQIAVASPLLANPVTAAAATATIAAAAKGLVSNALTTGAGVASILATSIGKFAKPDSTPPDTTTPPPPGDLGGGGGGAPTFAAPQFFGLGQGQLQSGQSGGQQQVVVLENDITRTQNRVRVIENRATIG